MVSTSLLARSTTPTFTHPLGPFVLHLVCCHADLEQGELKTLSLVSRISAAYAQPRLFKTLGPLDLRHAHDSDSSVFEIALRPRLNDSRWKYSWAVRSLIVVYNFPLLPENLTPVTSIDSSLLRRECLVAALIKALPNLRHIRLIPHRFPPPIALQQGIACGSIASSFEPVLQALASADAQICSVDLTGFDDISPLVLDPNENVKGAIAVRPETSCTGLLRSIGTKLTQLRVKMNPLGSIRCALLHEFLRQSTDLVALEIEGIKTLKEIRTWLVSIHSSSIRVSDRRQTPTCAPSLRELRITTHKHERLDSKDGSDLVQDLLQIFPELENLHVTQKMTGNVVDVYQLQLADITAARIAVQHIERIAWPISEDLKLTESNCGNTNGAGCGTANALDRSFAASPWGKLRLPKVDPNYEKAVQPIVKAYTRHALETMVHPAGAPATNFHLDIPARLVPTMSLNEAALTSYFAWRGPWDDEELGLWGTPAWKHMADFHLGTLPARRRLIDRSEWHNIWLPAVRDDI